MKKEKLAESELTQELLQEFFEYKEGTLIWKKRARHHFTSDANCKRFNTPNVGKVAGYFNKRTDSKREGFGYWRVGITCGGRLGHFKLHRLIWLYHKGYLPEVVDHEDTNTNNNNITNLREATFQTNSCNENTPVHNTTGYKGVSFSNEKVRRNKPYRASIEYKGYSFSSGNYSCAEYAAAVYNYMAKRLHGEFALLNDITLTDEDVDVKGVTLKTYLPQIVSGTFDWSKRTKRTRNKVVSL